MVYFERNAASKSCSPIHRLCETENERSILNSFQGAFPGKTHSEPQQASGHDFSRAANARESMRALAPEG